MLALLLVAGALGLNNFAVSIATGLSGADRAVRVRAALAFGLFETGMPIVGLLIGRHLSHSLGTHAHTIGGLPLIELDEQHRGDRALTCLGSRRPRLPNTATCVRVRRELDQFPALVGIRWPL